MKKYKLIDLFSGVGGISQGFHWAGFETIIANEYDTSIGNAYKANFPKAKTIISDIRELDFKKIMQENKIKPGEIDVIAGGPPCQGFSMANRKRIEEDERNLLFLEFVRAVKEFKPKCFLIENVMGMTAEKVAINANERSVINSMTDYFSDLGYKIAFKSFKAEEHGVPQMRRRVIVIGTNIESKSDDLKYLRIGNLKKKYLSKEEMNKIQDIQHTLFEDSLSKELKYPTTVWEAISDLPQIENGGGTDEMKYISKAKNSYQALMRECSKKVYNHKSTPHSTEVLKRIALVKQGQNFKDLPEELRTKSVHSGAYGRLTADYITPTITTRFDTPSTGRVIHPFLNRTLTVREAARLQSFPDHFKFIGTRTSQGKQVGNAVPPLVAKSIAEMFIRDFLS
ncbi:DNA cytosine methyltransferase [bacterium]|nr:DNA cytosine methyltransferase [bacterium]